jgi:hypothetical protein
MTEGEKFIATILHTKDIAGLVSIKEELLYPIEVKIIRFIRRYYTKYSKLPPVRIVNDEFGTTIAPIRGLTVDFTIQKLKERKVFTDLSKKLPELMKDLKSDPFKVLEQVKLLTEKLDPKDSESEDVYYGDNASSRIEEYNALTKNKGITYLSMGHALLDQLFLGYKNADLITIGGRSGTKKTWALLYLLVLAEDVLPENMGPLLFVSNEMMAKELIERLDCLRFLLPFSEYLRGELSKEQKIRYLKGLEKLEEKRSRVLIIYNCSTLQEFEYKLRLYRPSAAFVDGSYLFEPDMEEGFAKTTFITRRLKKITLTEKLPIINTTQLRKNTGKKKTVNSLDGQDEFFHGSYIQDSDTAITTYVDPSMVYRESVGWVVVKGRKLPPNTTLEFIAPLTSMKFDFVPLTDDDDGYAPPAMLQGETPVRQIKVKTDE